MRSMVLGVAAAALLGGAASAQGFNVSGGYTIFDGDDSSLGALTGRIGYDLSTTFGVEAEGHFGVTEEDFPGGSSKLESGFSGYGVARFPIDMNGSNVFGRVGYGTLTFEASGFGATASEDVSGFAYGGGGVFMVTRRFGIRGDYTRFESDDDFVDGASDTYSISALMRF